MIVNDSAADTDQEGVPQRRQVPECRWEAALLCLLYFKNKHCSISVMLCDFWSFKGSLQHETMLFHPFVIVCGDKQ